MTDVTKAAIGLFAEGFQDFEAVHTSWPNEHSCYILRHHADGSTLLGTLYFHNDNVILDPSPELGDGAWIRFPYADPAYPFNLIELLYDRLRGYLRHLYRFGDALSAGATLHLQKTEESIDLLLAHNQRLHLGEADGRPSVLVIAPDRVS